MVYMLWAFIVFLLGVAAFGAVISLALTHLGIRGMEMNHRTIGYAVFYMFLAFGALTAAIKIAVNTF